MAVSPREKRLDRALQAAIRALAFYMNPDTYWAIGFLQDGPSGDFMKDFERVDGAMRPGKRARAAYKKIAKILQVIADEGKENGK